MSKDDDEYQVGYGRPPKHSRFQKGRSGNPKGRPKGARGLSAILTAELQKKVPIREGGRTRLVSKLELFVLKRVNDALKGNARDGDALTSLIQRFIPLAETDAVPEALSEADQAILDHHLGTATQSNGSSRE